MMPIAIPGFADPVSSLTHLLAALTAFVGGFFLWRRGRGNGARLFSLMLFSFSLVFLFSMSGVFHLLDRGGGARAVLQRLDHAAIWTLIAGSFTPIHMILFRGPARWLILLLVWIFAVTALVLEVVFFHDIPELLLLTLFLGLGWAGAVSGHLFRRNYRDPSIRWLAGGGLSYSVGALIDFLKWPTPIEGVLGPHEIFHVFVILGAACHWVFVFRWANHPIRNHLDIDVFVSPTGHHSARAVGEDINVEADSAEELRAKIRAVLKNRYHDSIEPTVRLRYVKVETL